MKGKGLLEQNTFQNGRTRTVSNYLLLGLSDAKPSPPPILCARRPHALCSFLFSTSWNSLYPSGPAEFPLESSPVTGVLSSVVAPVLCPIGLTQHMLFYPDIYGSVLQVGNSLRAGTMMFIHWFIHPLVKQILIETHSLAGPVLGAGICAESQA